jgi:hypothetical protein
MYIIPPDIKSTAPPVNLAVLPVGRVLTVLPTDALGPAAPGLAARAAQFVVGRDYSAQVLAKVAENTYHVKVENGGAEGVTLKMVLGSSAQAGQTLSLRYMLQNPVPTFLLLPATSGKAGSTTDLSSAAKLIGQYLQTAADDGVSSRHEASAVVSHNPKNPQLLAQDLKQALTGSGLFYESHLTGLLQGKASLAAIRQEPQNQAGTQIATLLSQQLAILENQRITWQGEVWNGQKMDLDVYLQPREDKDDSQPETEPEAIEDRPISSELTLHLPQLGTVRARISLNDGRMRVSISANEAHALVMLRKSRQALAEAIGRNGQQLDALTVMRHE